MSLQNVDRLSSMPEEIRSEILSLLPTIFAVRTSILSKNWRYSWTFVTNLDFDENDINSFRFSYSWTKSVLKFLKTSQLNLFRLHISKGWFATSYDVLNWINEAVWLNVHELDIDVNVIRLQLPLSLFTCKTLTKFRIDNWRIELSDQPFNLPSLKSLDITVYTSPFVSAFKLIRGCPMLESLSLEISNWYNENEEDYIFNIPTLKRLKLIWVKWGDRINRVVLNVPNLEYLYVGGVLCSDFVMEDVWYLVTASISFSGKSYHHLWAQLLKGISGVKFFFAHNVSSFIDLMFPFTSRVPVFPNMKQLVLKGFWHYGIILQFLQSFPELKHLCIEEAEEHSWIEPKLVPACMLTNLTTFKYSKGKGQKWDLSFLEYMFGNAMVLKMVTIIWENLCAEEETRLGAWLLKVPRASRCCEIHFLGN